MALGGADHVGVQAWCAQALVVADRDRPTPVEEGLDERALVVGALGQRVGGRAVVADPAGTHCVGHERPAARPGPRRRRDQDRAADRHWLAQRVGRPVEHLLRRHPRHGRLGERIEREMAYTRT